MIAARTSFSLTKSGIFTGGGSAAKDAGPTPDAPAGAPAAGVGDAEPFPAAGFPNAAITAALATSAGVGTEAAGVVTADAVAECAAEAPPRGIPRAAITFSTMPAMTCRPGTTGGLVVTAPPAPAAAAAAIADLLSGVGATVALIR